MCLALFLMRCGGTEIKIKRTSRTFTETSHSIYTWTRGQARIIVNLKYLVRSGRRQFRPKKCGVAPSFAVPLDTSRGGKTWYESCELEMIYRVKRMMRIIRDKLTHNVVLSKYPDDLKVIISLFAKVL